MAQSDAQLKAVNLKGAPRNLNFSDSIAERFKERARMPLAPITDYLIISNRRDTTSLDTTLTMQLLIALTQLVEIYLVAFLFQILEGQWEN